jgi:hypothetical protein
MLELVAALVRNADAGACGGIEGSSSRRGGRPRVLQARCVPSLLLLFLHVFGRRCTCDGARCALAPWGPADVWTSRWCRCCACLAAAAVALAAAALRHIA